MSNYFQRARRHRVLSFCRQHNLSVQFQNEVSAHLKLEYLSNLEPSDDHGILIATLHANLEGNWFSLAGENFLELIIKLNISRVDMYVTYQIFVSKSVLHSSRMIFTPERISLSLHLY
jgi:hypothetical protein